MEKRHRVFIAISLPADIRKELFRYSEKWPELPAKWTPKDNLHITLEFLGALTDIEIADACQVAKEAAQRHEIFPMSLNKVIYGPPDKMPPKMVWAVGEKSWELAELKNDLQDCLLEKIKFRPDDSRPDRRSSGEGGGFAPHITLARILEWEFRKIEPEERPEINEGIDLSFTAESIEVMESEMKRGGPVYTILESHSLGNNSL